MKYALTGYKKIYAILVCLTVLILAGCGYQLRSYTQWPSQLTILKFEPATIPAEAQVSLKLFLKSMHVKIAQEAPYTFTASNYQYTQTQPDSSNSAVPSTITFSVSETISIENKNGKTCLAPFSVSSEFSELEQKTGVVVSSVDPDIKARLLENINQDIFEKLTSQDMISQLNSKQCQPLNHKKS